MANHFFSINRGKDGMQPSDITQAATSTAGDDIELRVADGASLTRLDLEIACDAFKRRFAETDQTTFPPI